MLLTRYYSGDQIKGNESGGACSMCGCEEKCIQGFCGKILEKEITWKIRRRWKIILKWKYFVLWEGVDWIHLTQDRDK